MTRPPTQLVLVLHGHIPDVIGHGVWPHGANWLYEAAAETYIPFLRTVEALLAKGLPVKATIGMTPVLSEQLRDPRFKGGFVKYAAQRAKAARTDREHLASLGDGAAADVAEFWNRYYLGILEDFAARPDQDLILSLRALAQQGAIEPIASAATHGFLPLLPDDRAIERQLDVGLRAHERNFGIRARGLWLPECAYRPAGPWRSPAGGPEVVRPGLEESLATFGVEFFFVETHLIQGGRTLPAYGGEVFREDEGGTPYRVYYLPAPAGRVHVMARDPLSSQQVWSGKVGYPGDGRYLEFHKKRAPSGHRFWRVTDSRLDLHEKLPYEPAQVPAALASHADHFVSLLENVQPLEDGTPPVVVAMFDFELFGHWWFEGVEFLGAVFERLAARTTVVAVTASEAIAAVRNPRPVRMPAGTWGRGGDFQVWWNDGTIPFWREVEAVEKAMELFEARRASIPDELFSAMERQTLLLQSSDWPFLIDNEVSKDYAEKRIAEHTRDFWRLAAMAESGRVDTSVLAEIWEKDRVFEEELRSR
jgi:1,4-alpha-glucan branching enzyme